MFAPHFAKQTELLQSALAKSLRRKGPSAPERRKDMKLYESFHGFLKGHLPPNFGISTGRQVRNHKQILKKDCDLLLYKSLCANYLSMTGGYVLSEDIYAAFTVESSYKQQALGAHLSLTRALKSLYISQKEEAAQAIIPLYSIFFAYASQNSLLAIKQYLLKYLEQKEIPINQQLDMICILGKGIIIKDWENQGRYRGLETGRDTLMWFYIILMEYLDRGGDEYSLPLRDYVKSGSAYKEC